MKKLLLFIGLTMLCFLSGCGGSKLSHARLQDVNDNLQSYTVADLIVAENKITYTYDVPRGERRRRLEEKLVNKAVTLALMANGNADKLVSRSHVVEYNFWGKPTKITVTGYPARYKNFNKAVPAETKKDIRLEVKNDDM